jgi:hypothetical protein
MRYHRHLEEIAVADIDYVRKKDTQYQASWKRRGGVGAFFTFARPWDRLESIAGSANYDIFKVIRHEGLAGPDGSLIACVRDLRRYLLLLEAEMTEQLPTMAEIHDIAVHKPGTPEDGGHHAEQG